MSVINKNMFQYEYEKRPPSRDSHATVAPRWHSRPLPPRPEDTLPTKTSVPLKVWIIASASCFAVCGALVLATIVITRWGASESYAPRAMFAEAREPIYANPYPEPRTTTTEADTASQEIDNDIQFPILEKLSIFKNIVANRDKKKEENNLIFKPQIHPAHDTSLHHPERKIEKKDQAKLPQDFVHPKVPEFKPTLPDVFIEDSGIKLSDGYIAGLKRVEDNYEEYYNDENLYDDYMQSNSMTNYLIEKVQELHDWITSDPDFDNKTEKRNSGNEFGQLLKALNESLIEGNVTIVMSKLKEIYLGENFTISNQSRKVILSNSTNLLSFGILTLDVMLLHNIQLMAWEAQESARHKMLRDPDVFAFNALFMEPGKVEAKRNEILHQHDNLSSYGKRQNRQEDDSDFGKNLLENVLEIGMSTARAAIHLGRAFKNTKIVLNQLANKESLNANIQNQISRNIDANTHALNHLQTSFNKNDSYSVASGNNGIYTDLDCVWLLYCKNLVATAKLNAPYGTMARINGLALRMLTGELPTDRAFDTMLYEVMTGWTELKCNDMFPRCSKANAANVVLESILQPLRKSQSSNRL
ncbi:uncharacterized protein LOC123666081 [Melitaea cinxia]|uniref:uncharacterized protein LOC123666081 n=1 Tax=Melitaea cinxia TaxID=113334 RepID=UPI001E270AF0|nr:uncharacterized protein LOC123666081 [Melitaea cinxia]